MLKKFLFLSGALFGALLLSACEHTSEKPCCPKGEHKHHKDSKDSACCGKASTAGLADVKGLKNSKVKGQVSFSAVAPHKVKVNAHIKGLPANKQFGFHVHEFGTCEDDGLRAGGHFNPWKAKHGGPAGKERHFGDLGNLSSDKQGHAVYSVVVKGRPHKFLGRSVIVHAQADDLKAQPAGNAGARIACGVITAGLPPLPKKESAVSDKKHWHKTKAAAPHKTGAKAVKKASQAQPAQAERGSASSHADHRSRPATVKKAVPAQEAPTAEPVKAKTGTPAEGASTAEPVKAKTGTPAEEAPTAEPVKAKTGTPAEEAPTAEPAKVKTKTPAEGASTAAPVKVKRKTRAGASAPAPTAAQAVKVKKAVSPKPAEETSATPQSGAKK